MRRKLKEIHKQFGLTLIYVTHDQTEAMTFADEIMYDGALLQIGAPDELFEGRAHTFVDCYFGSPGMNLIPCTVDGNMAVMDCGRILWTRPWRPGRSGELPDRHPPPVSGAGWPGAGRGRGRAHRLG